jgi:hypothetical protein
MEFCFNDFQYEHQSLCQARQDICEVGFSSLVLYHSKETRADVLLLKILNSFHSDDFSSQCEERICGLPMLDLELGQVRSIHL